MDSRVHRITAEIAAVIERNLRREMLREREEMLRKELQAVRTQLSRLGASRPASVPAGKPASAVRPSPKPQAKARPVQSLSARGLIIDTLKRTRRPMTIRELTKAILKKGWKSVRKNPIESVDAAVRSNPQNFRRTAPSTFELNQ